jgi:RNA polymerase sigma-70 factor (ECF subfamily)
VFRRLVVGEMDTLYRSALHLARNHDDALDLTQESYLRAFRAEDSFELRDRGVRPWLLKIMHNVFYSKLERKRLEPVLLGSMDYESPTERDMSFSGRFDRGSLDWEQVDDRLKDAVQSLPEHYLQVLLLWAVEGHRYREIADALDIPLGTVMSRLHRARAILAEQLSDLASEYGFATRAQSSLT